MKEDLEKPRPDRANAEERFYGKFMPDKIEIARVRKEATDKKQDPDVAELEYFKKFDAANAKIRREQGEEARKSLEKSMK
jgi:hypothetical protein